MTRQRPGFSRASSPAVSPTGSPARRRLEAAWSRRPRLSACHGFEARPRQPGAGKGRPRACRPVARSGRMAHVKKSSSCRQSLPSSLCHPNAQISIRLSRSEGASLWPKGSRISGMRDNWLSNRIFTSTRTSSNIAARLGTGSPISHGASCPSEYVSGPMGSDY